MPAWITGLAHTLQPWSDLYNGYNAVSDGVTFVHLAAILLAGGLAVSADRTTLRVSRGPADERRLALRQLTAVHRPVVGGLAVVAVSGMAMMLSDVRTFLPSPVFWVKMALVALLLLNGVTLLAAERHLETDPDDAPHWRALRAGSVRSATLWFLILLFGVMLTSVG